MNLDRSVELMVERLQLNQGFPKYQFERSLDGFLSLFLVEFFSEKDRDQFVYIAAEFPMRKEKFLATDKETYQSTNVDYLLLRKGTCTQWYFIELKTDQSSERDIQLQRLNSASGKNFSEFYNQIEGIQKKSKQKEKYAHLLRNIKAHSTEQDREAQIHSICLTNYTPQPRIKKAFDQIEWLQLSEFDAKLINTEHPELWQKVKFLFKDKPQKAS
jgi:hypothetical protein